MAEYIDREIMIRLFQSFKVVNNLSPYDAVLVSDITDFINDVPTADIKPGEDCNDCYFRKMLEGVEIAEVVHGRNLKEKY